LSIYIVNNWKEKRKGAPTPRSNGPRPGREALGVGFGASLNKIVAWLNRPKPSEVIWSQSRLELSWSCLELEFGVGVVWSWPFWAIMRSLWAILGCLGLFWVVLQLFCSISKLFQSFWGPFRAVSGPLEPYWARFVPSEVAWCCCMVIFGCHGFIKVNSWHFGLFCISLGHAKVVFGSFWINLDCFGLFWVVLFHFKVISKPFRAFSSCLICFGLVWSACSRFEWFWSVSLSY
jgi:hypothetical protein